MLADADGESISVVRCLASDYAIGDQSECPGASTHWSMASWACTPKTAFLVFRAISLHVHDLWITAFDSGCLPSTVSVSPGNV